jgi:hypothetical protein
MNSRVTVIADEWSADISDEHGGLRSIVRICSCKLINLIIYREAGKAWGNDHLVACPVASDGTHLILMLL